MAEIFGAILAILVAVVVAAAVTGAVVVCIAGSALAVMSIWRRPGSSAR